MNSHTVFCNTWTFTLSLATHGLYTISLNTWALSHYFVQRMDFHKFSCNSQPMNTTLFLATHELYGTLFLATHGLSHFLLQHIDSHTSLATHGLSNTTTLQSNTLCHVDVLVNMWTPYSIPWNTEELTSSLTYTDNLHLHVLCLQLAFHTIKLHANVCICRFIDSSKLV
jgi:hypothetical protein